MTELFCDPYKTSAFKIERKENIKKTDKKMTEE